MQSPGISKTSITRPSIDSIITTKARAKARRERARVLHTAPMEQVHQALDKVAVAATWSIDGYFNKAAMEEAMTVHGSSDKARSSP